MCSFLWCIDSALSHVMSVSAWWGMMTENPELILWFMFISMEFPAWVESLRTTQFTLAHNVHMGSMSTRIIPTTFILCPCPISPAWL